VVDRDEPQGGHHFYFRLVPEAPSNPHFSLLDIQGKLPVSHQIPGCMERAIWPPSFLVEAPRGPVLSQRSQSLGPAGAVLQPLAKP
jgi:hypothetical protein